MFNVVLVEPEIPPNTGNIGRLCLATCSTLHLVRPLGFSLEDRQLKRAGLDYWGEVDLQDWGSLAELQRAQAADARYFFLTTKTNRAYYTVKFQRAIFSFSVARRRGCRRACWRRTRTIAHDPDAGRAA